MIEKLLRLAKRPVSRRGLFGGIGALVASGFAAKWLIDEHATPAIRPAADAAIPPAAGTLIDVGEFKKTMSVEELNRTAEAYFARASNWDHFHAKPLGHINEAPGLLRTVADVLSGLQLLPGMSVIDFGAGSCWLTRWLSQLGMEAIALDVSATALRVGQALYARYPVIGKQPPPRFLHFDGRRIELPDASVDRILVHDVFHHLLNPDEVLAEMFRVLKRDGIAGFSEPGPRHSLAPGAQYAMRQFRVLEDNVDIHRIWASAQRAGFARVRLAVVNAEPFIVTLPEFDDYLAGGKLNERFAQLTRVQMQARRLFFLHKTAQAPTYDSRSAAGLAGTLQVQLAATRVRQGEPLSARVVVTNSGKAVWLPHSAHSGGVTLGCRMLDASGKVIDGRRFQLTPGDGRPIAPGEAVTVQARITAPVRGRYLLEFDLVSQATAWFSQLGSQAVRVDIEVT